MAHLPWCVVVIFITFTYFVILHGSYLTSAYTVYLCQTNWYGNVKITILGSMLKKGGEN